MSESGPIEIARKYAPKVQAVDSEPVLIDWDHDSAAYRVGPKVLKIYTGDFDKNPLSLPQVELYRDITNEAKKYTEEHPVTIDLPEGAGSYPVRVNPINHVIWDPEDKIVIAVSDFVDGPTARMVFQTTVVDDTRREVLTGDTYWWDRYPETNELRKYFISKGLRQPHKVDRCFYAMDEKLNKVLKTEGIFPGLNNTKIVAANKNQLEFVITDLCVNVTLLKRVSK